MSPVTAGADARSGTPARPAADVLAEIDKFRPKNGDWRPLSALLRELRQCDLPPEATDVLLGVFERYPTEDGAGAFWNVVEILESRPGYEERLVASLRRAPSEFALKMANRLIEAGRGEVRGVPVFSLIEEVSRRPDVETGVRLLAEAFVAARDG
jgi:hypothetical protein